MPVLFFCTGKPGSADVASIVYARQRHSRTTRSQLNLVAGPERLCHGPILADPNAVSLWRARWEQKMWLSYACRCDAAR